MKNRARILIVDDDPLIRQSCEDILGPEGYSPKCAATAEQGERLILEDPFDLIVTDLKMPGKDGLHVLRFAEEKCPDVPVIVLTGYPALDSAIKSVRLGAFDYLCKPLSPDELLVAVSRALANRRLILENRYLRRRDESRQVYQEIIAHSQAMQDVLYQVERVAPTETTVLLVGESGVGKEVVARAIRRNSPRKDNQFIVVDCATLSPSVLESELFGHVRGAFTGATTTKAGLFEIANEGTLFLDEVANINLEIQSKLLRVLEAHEFKPVGSATTSITDVRLIAATNCDLQEKIKAGTFRQDLFYRLNVFPIRVPPLRERSEDITALAELFLRDFATRANKPAPRFSESARNTLNQYSWPGNVRELRNVIERIVIMTDGPSVEIAHLSQNDPESLARPIHAIPRTVTDLKIAKKQAKERAVEELERAFVLQALKRASGSVSEAARQTGMQRTYLQALMRRHSISAQESQGRDQD